MVAWDEFAEIYAPVVYRSARRQGLQSADADDVVQEVLAAVAQSVTQWLQRDDQGLFRKWPMRIARNTAIDFLTRRKHRAGPTRLRWDGFRTSSGYFMYSIWTVAHGIG